MKQYVDETLVAVPAEPIYRALCDVARWPVWDEELEAAHIEGAAVAGARFTLRPKGGPNVRMEVVAAERPHRFVDRALLPLARIQTTHDLEARGDGTLVRSVISVTGPLAFLWDRLVARKLADDAHAQTLRLAAYVQAQS